MAKGLRSKRKRKFRALKRIKHKPKLDAKMREIAIELTKGDENMKEQNSNEGAPLKIDSEEKLANPESDSHGNNENSDRGDDDDVDMETNDSAKPKSNKRATVPVHLLSQRKFRKLKLQQKQKKANKKKKFLKW